MPEPSRSPDALRPLDLQIGFTKAALGSVLISTGGTRVLCTASLERRTPSWLKSGGWITAEYSMLPGATHPRGRRDAGGRGKEIQRLIGRSLRAGVELAALTGPGGPGEGLCLVCDCDVIDADGGTRTASITGAWVALEIALRKLMSSGQLASHPGRAQIAAVSVGLVEPKVGEAPTPLLDLCYSEDSRAHVDLNVVMRGHGEQRPGLIEVQGTGERGDFSRAQLEAMLDLAESGIARLLKAQAAALKDAGL